MSPGVGQLVRAAAQPVTALSHDAANPPGACAVTPCVADFVSLGAGPDLSPHSNARHLLGYSQPEIPPKHTFQGQGTLRAVGTGPAWTRPGRHRRRGCRLPPLLPEAGRAAATGTGARWSAVWSPDRPARAPLASAPWPWRRLAAKTPRSSASGSEGGVVVTGHHGLGHGCVMLTAPAWSPQHVPFLSELGFPSQSQAPLLPTGLSRSVSPVGASTLAVPLHHILAHLPPPPRGPPGLLPAPAGRCHHPGCASPLFSFTSVSPWTRSPGPATGISPSGTDGPSADTERVE